MSACADCGCDPRDERTLGRHGGADCINANCPAGCAGDQAHEEAVREAMEADEGRQDWLGGRWEA